MKPKPVLFIVAGVVLVLLIVLAVLLVAGTSSGRHRSWGLASSQPSAGVFPVDLSNEAETAPTAPLSSSGAVNLSFKAAGPGMTSQRMDACGENLYWDLTDGVLTISGRGDMWDYDPGNANGATTAPWYGDRNTVKRLVIEEGVTSVGCSAFYGCKNLSYASLPDSLRAINGFAFWGTGLYELRLPENVRTIGPCAFGASSLSGIGLPEGMTEIEDMAFQDSRLYGLSIPGTVTSIGAAFGNCQDLERLCVPKSVRSIDENAFSSCEKLVLCGLPGSYVQSYAEEHGILFELSQGKCGENLSWELDGDLLTIRGTGPMYGFNDYDVMPPWSEAGLSQSIGKLRIEEGATSVSLMAFYHCLNLREARLPESLVSIAPVAFAESGLTSIRIPKNVKSVGEAAFEFCSYLEQVQIDSSETLFGENVFSGTGVEDDIAIRTLPQLGEDPLEVLIHEQFPFLGEYPSDSDLDYLEKETGTKISRPSESQLLDSYELRYVHSKGGSSIYYFWKPAYDDEYKLKRTIAEDTPLIVLARKNDMLCVTFSLGGSVKYGWVSESLTTGVSPSGN